MFLRGMRLPVSGSIIRSWRPPIGLPKEPDGIDGGGADGRGCVPLEVVPFEPFGLLPDCG
jgi:hypothetical protein